jgi:hypothetical protein
MDKPTEIYECERLIQDTGGFYYLFITDTGNFTSKQMAQLLGVSENTFLGRIYRAKSCTDQSLLKDKSTRGRKPIEDQECTEEWLNLGDEDRVDPDAIEIGEFELDSPDPFDPIKAAEHDRERYGRCAI